MTTAIKEPPSTMSRSVRSDPVNDEYVNSYLLPTTFQSDYVEHRTVYSDRTRGIRKKVRAQRWITEKEIGRGGFGIVRLQREERTHELRAVKEVSRHFAAAIDPLRELTAMASMSKDESNFVKLQGWFQNETHLFIAMEYFELGDLTDCVTAPLPESDCQNITYQITEALKFMHDRNFAHRDLKPSNIFVVRKSPEWWVKVADFGISKRHSENTALHTSLSGDSDFAAPELRGFTDDFTITNSVDLWSIGCMAAWLVIFDILLPLQNMYAFSRGRHRIAFEKLAAAGLTPEGVTFVAALLLYEPQTRLTAAEALNHEWLLPLANADTLASSASDDSRQASPISAFADLVISEKSIKSTSVPPSSHKLKSSELRTDTFPSRPMDFTRLDNLVAQIPSSGSDWTLESSLSQDHKYEYYRKQVGVALFEELSRRGETRREGATIISQGNFSIKFPYGVADVELLPGIGGYLVVWRAMVEQVLKRLEPTVLEKVEMVTKSTSPRGKTSVQSVQRLSTVKKPVLLIEEQYDEKIEWPHPSSQSNRQPAKKVNFAAETMGSPEQYKTQLTASTNGGIARQRPVGQDSLQQRTTSQTFEHIREINQIQFSKGQSQLNRVPNPSRTLEPAPNESDRDFPKPDLREMDSAQSMIDTSSQSQTIPPTQFRSELIVSDRHPSKTQSEEKRIDKLSQPGPKSQCWVMSVDVRRGFGVGECCLTAIMSDRTISQIFRSENAVLRLKKKLQDKWPAEMNAVGLKPILWFLQDSHYGRCEEFLKKFEALPKYVKQDRLVQKFFSS